MKLDKNIKDYFTYGFELEGNFTYHLLKKIDREAALMRKKENRLNFVERKFDGSVRDLCPSIPHYEIVAEEEVNVGIFKDFDNMLKILGMFRNEKDYFSNYSCGLHVHIKPKKRELRRLFADYDYIRNLQNFARLNLCPEVRARIEGMANTTNYCKTYGNFISTLYSWKGSQKYLFVRNHPLGTLEFRFLSACEHKVENAKRFFGYLFRTLSKVKPIKEKTSFIEISSEKEPHNYNKNYIIKTKEKRKIDFIINHSIHF